MNRTLELITPVKNPFPDYDWMARHRQVLEELKRHPEMIFIGDSITHYFGGRPEDDIVRAGDVWDRYYGHRHAVNLRFGWDRIQHMLWRLDNGALEGIAPKVAVVLAGTNNVLWEESSAESIAEGIRILLERLRQRLATTKVLRVGILPFGPDPETEKRKRIKEINRITASFADGSRIFHIDVGDRFVTSDGFLRKELFLDNLHPNQQGYAVYATAIEPMISTLLSSQ